MAVLSSLGAHDSQGHNPNINNGCVFDISDDSLSEGPPDADISGLNCEVPLSDPISEFFPFKDFPKLVMIEPTEIVRLMSARLLWLQGISRDPLRLHDVNSLALSNGLSL